MDWWIGDWDVIKTAERREKEKRARKQCSRTCHACKKHFESGNKLFRHLQSQPNHKCDLHWLHYNMRCKIHSEYRARCLNFFFDHLDSIPERPNYYTECKEVYVESIEITPYYREKETYTITDFDPEDLKREWGYYRRM
jgi:hypothetical protein